MLNYKKLIEDGKIDELFNKFLCTDDYQRLVVKSMLIETVRANPKEYAVDDIEEVKKAVFGDHVNDLKVQVLDIASSWANDVESAFCLVTGYTGDVFKDIFALLNEYVEEA